MKEKHKTEFDKWRSIYVKEENERRAREDRMVHQAAVAALKKSKASTNKKEG